MRNPGRDYGTVCIATVVRERLASSDAAAGRVFGRPCPIGVAGCFAVDERDEPPLSC